MKKETDKEIVEQVDLETLFSATNAENLERAIVIGITKEGKFYFAANHCDLSNLVENLVKAQHYLLRNFHFDFKE